ncbi:MAG: hypothetical protein RR036_02310 [Oscillospiraceae bacterium]
MQETIKDFFTYKAKPLVRCGDTIYYGDMSQAYVAMLQINSYSTQEEIQLPDLIHVQLMRTQKGIKPQDIIVKKSEQRGLFNALDIADVWLTKALSEEE